MVISTHAPLARCNKILNDEVGYLEISTHAPLARCNFQKLIWNWNFQISTHAPLARCNFSFILCTIQKMQFLLTHLLRGATNEISEQAIRNEDFHSRTSCEVQLVHCHHIRLPHSISTHAPLARCNHLFFWTTPLISYISTHAPLARCNLVHNDTKTVSHNFYSRTSWEVQRW